MKQDGTLSSAYKKEDKSDYCNSRYGESKKTRERNGGLKRKKKVEGRKNKKNERSSTFLSTLVDLWNGDQI